MFQVTRFSEIASYVKHIEIFYSIYEKVKDEGFKTIGINGVDTSGKIMFTNAFSRFLDGMNVKNQIIYIDDYHNPSAIRMQGKDEIDAYYKNAFHYSQLIDEVLLPAKSGVVDKVVCCLNLNTDKYENEIYYYIDEENLILLEGVLLFRTPLIEYIDEKVFIDVSLETVMKRAKQRDVPIYGEEFLQKYERKYIPVQKRYLEEYQPKKMSDFVIDNKDYNAPYMVEVEQNIALDY